MKNIQPKKEQQLDKKSPIKKRVILVGRCILRLIADEALREVASHLIEQMLQ